MAETQKEIIEKLLKEKGKTKRDLAKRLKIKENSINRTLNNSSISLSKLMIIADFLDVDIYVLLPRRETAHEVAGKYHGSPSSDTSNQQTIEKLSEALNRNSQTIESLVKLITNNPEK